MRTAKPAENRARLLITSVIAPPSPHAPPTRSYKVVHPGRRRGRGGRRYEAERQSPCRVPVLTRESQSPCLSPLFPPPQLYRETTGKLGGGVGRGGELLGRSAAPPRRDQALATIARLRFSRVRERTRVGRFCMSWPRRGWFTIRVLFCRTFSHPKTRCDSTARRGRAR